MIVFSLTFSLSYKTMITFWYWPTYIILVFCVSPFNHSWFTAGYFPAHRNPPYARQYYISYYPYSLYYFLNISNLINYQSWISWPRFNSYYVSHPRLPQVCDWNIQSCRGWWIHPWLWYSWHSLWFGCLQFWVCLRPFA